MADTALLTATTKLEAVKWALKALGFSEVSTLEGTIGRDASAVVTSIDNKVRSLCRAGYWFSTRETTFTPDPVTSYIAIPTNVLSLFTPKSACGSSWYALEWQDEKPTIRQGKLFSIVRQSYLWIRPMLVGINEALLFEDLPDEARAFVQVYAALEVNHAILRSDDVAKRLEPLLAQTWNDFLQADLDNSHLRFL